MLWNIIRPSNFLHDSIMYIFLKLYCQVTLTLSFIHTCSLAPLKPISSSQGMGTLISLLPQSLSLLPLLPTVPLSFLSPPLYPLHHIPALWYSTVLLLNTPFSFPHSVLCSLSLSWFPASLCPSVPNLPWSGSVFFSIICFWFPRIRKPLCACCLFLTCARAHTHTCTVELTYTHTTYTHIFIVLFYKSSYKSLVINRPQTALPPSFPPLLLRTNTDQMHRKWDGKKGTQETNCAFSLFFFFSPLLVFSVSPHPFFFREASFMYKCPNPKLTEGLKFKLRFRRKKEIK